MDKLTPNDTLINVLVCATTDTLQIQIPVSLPFGKTIIQAIRLSGIEKQLDYPVTADNIGIFSQKAKPDDIVQADDRIEIYRPLKITAQQLRQKHALRRKQSRRAQQ